jgi:hypothetical protein
LQPSFAADEDEEEVGPSMALFTAQPEVDDGESKTEASVSLLPISH